MSAASATTAAILASIRNAHRSDEPYRHYLLSDMLPPEDVKILREMDVPVPKDFVFEGKRENNNGRRLFANKATRALHPVFDRMCESFDSAEVRQALTDSLGAKLDGNRLRIEFALDTEGFWLEPHTDVGAKKMTLLIYLNDADQDMGTDIYNSALAHQGRAPAPPNSGLFFVPGSDTFHGFERRAFKELRRTVIINFVGPEWRNTDELALG